MINRKSSSSKTREIIVNRTMSALSVRTRDGFEIPVLKVPSPFQGFINFVREQGVVGLGVGVVIGTSANTLVKSMVTNLFNPFVGLFTGGINLSQKTVCLNSTAGVCKNILNYGQVISDLMTFAIILLIVYFVVKSLRLDKVDKPKATK